MSKKKPLLIDDWRDILNKAWSVKWWLLSLVLGSLEQLLPLVADSVTPSLFAKLSLVAGLCGIAARLIPQFMDEEEDEERQNA